MMVKKLPVGAYLFVRNGGTLVDMADSITYLGLLRHSLTCVIPGLLSVGLHVNTLLSGIL